MSTLDAGPLSGTVVPGWEPVRDAFVANFTERAEVGASVCVYRDGVAVVDLWGGLADVTTGRPWARDTIVLVYSMTKGISAVCANLLIERGRVDRVVGGRGVLVRRVTLSRARGARSVRARSR